MKTTIEQSIEAVKKLIEAIETGNVFTIGHADIANARDSITHLEKLKELAKQKLALDEVDQSYIEGFRDIQSQLELLL